MIDKNKTQELQYLMRYYHIESIPLCSKGKYLGEVTVDLKYKVGNALSNYTSIDYAIEQAIAEINDIIEVEKEWDQPTKVEVEFVDHSWGWVKNSDGRSFYGQKNDVRVLTWEGTLDEVCEKMEKANNRLRYCNGVYYRFKDEKMRMKKIYWSHLISHARSFALYYPGNTVVD